jgi:GNAT superfamily N-acetyltransferase
MDAVSGAEAIRLRPMTPADVSLGMRLKTVAGWNQQAADWEMLLYAGEGLVAEITQPTGSAISVGTATVVPYAERFSWIGMVLVDPAYRRRGIGTRLLEAAVALARKHGAPRLDATPQGKPLYARLGFRPEYGLLRLGREGDGLFPQSQAAGVRCAQLTVARSNEVIAYDAPAFGAARPEILTALLSRAPHYAHVARWGAQIAGYVLGRPGSAYDQLGPVVADDLATARCLLSEALAHSAGRDVILDVPTKQAGWVAYLETLGFTRRRPFTRMALGRSKTFGQPGKQYAIAGPEIG